MKFKKATSLLRLCYYACIRCSRFVVRYSLKFVIVCRGYMWAEIGLELVTNDS